MTNLKIRAFIVQLFIVGLFALTSRSRAQPITINNSITAAQQEQMLPPYPWDGYVLQQQSYNIRSDLSPVENAPMHFALIPIPKNKSSSVMVYSSRHAAADQDYIIKDPSGASFLKVPYVYFGVDFDFPSRGEFQDAAQILKDLPSFGPALPAKLLISKNTYLTWGDGQAPVSFKLQRPYELRPNRYLNVNADFSAQVAIKHNDIVMDVLSRDPNRVYDYLPETFAATVKLAPRFKYTFLKRDLTALESPLVSNRDALTLHPLLSLLADETRMLDYAQKGGYQTGQEWFGYEYLPKLAEFLAQSHIRHGLRFVAHTQNLSLWVNATTGKISRFVVQDASDVLLHPMRLLNFMSRDEVATILLDPEISIAHRNFIDASNPELSDPIEHFFAFDLQSILGPHYNLSSYSGALMISFIELYLREAIKYLGPEAAQLLREYQSEIPKRLTNGPNSTSIIPLAYISQTLRKIEAYADLQTIQLDQLKIIDQATNKKRIKKLLINAQKDGTLVSLASTLVGKFLNPYFDPMEIDENAEFKYATDGIGVFIFSVKHNKLVAALPKLARDPNWLKQIQSAPSETNPCESALNRLPDAWPSSFQ